MEFETSVRVEAPREAVWPLLADTERLNREVGLPAIRFEFRPRPAGGTETWATLRLGGMTLRYREHPFEWAQPEFYRIRRSFKNGPLREFVGEVRLAPDGTGTRVTSRVTLLPSGPAGYLVAPLLARRAMADFTTVCRSFAAFLDRRLPTPYPRHAGRPPAVRERLERVRDALRPFDLDPGVVNRLVAHVTDAPPEDVVEIRPFSLADAWGMDRMAVLRACLVGARVGLLDLRWRLLCPSCRGGQANLSHLKEVSGTAHCETCNIRYDAEFDRSVEICFAVPPALRPVEVATYCVGGPGRTPHALAQWPLGPGETREVELLLPPGRYDLRSLQAPPPYPLRVDDTAGPGVEVAIVQAEHSSGLRLQVNGEEARFAEDAGAPPRAIPARGAWRVRNATDTPVILRLERADWTAGAATAALVTSLQAFRDLFSSEVLAPGMELAVRQICILFSDLKGSTAMYRRVGDAPSYRAVRDHFDLMRRVIGAQGGGVVKTIGDAVMAAFVDPADGLAAALAIQRQFLASPEGLTVKLGLHWGPAIAVNANDLLDYFGQTVNLAARLQEESEGGDIVLAAALAEDPQIARLLSDETLRIERFEAAVRGLEGPVAMIRVIPRA
jgi:class 3 adenylate cyclase